MFQVLYIITVYSHPPENSNWKLQYEISFRQVGVTRFRGMFLRDRYKIIFIRSQEEWDSYVIY